MANILETLNLIDSFAKLPKGWNFGEGVRASSLSLRQSKDMLRFAFDSGIREFEAFPGIDGEIQLCCYKEDDTLEITFEINGTTTVSFEKDDKRLFYKRGVAFNAAIKILKDFAYNKWRSFVQSTSTDTTAKRKNVSQEWLLDPHQQMAASPSSIRIVLSVIAEQSAVILSDSTPELQERQSYSGKFPMIQFPQCPV